jgi:amino acid transporter
MVETSVASLNVLIIHYRVFYAGSRQGHMPDFISLININRFTPVNAVGALVSGKIAF